VILAINALEITMGKKYIADSRHPGYHRLFPLVDADG
jgi:hypothetical protein